MGPPQAPETSKLRSSCDGCGTAKVKCDRGQPECGRCATLGLSCVYGLSRKFGKPRRKRPGADLDASVSPQKRMASATRDRCIAPTIRPEHPQTSSEPLQLNSSNPVTNVFPFSEPMPFGADGQNLFGSDFLTSLPIDGWLPLDTLGAELDVPPMSGNLGPDSQLSAPVCEPVIPDRPDAENEDSHSCPRESYEIFRDLICPSPSLHAPEANSETVSAQLDYVLHFNRNAIDRLSRVLRCDCAKSGHRGMVHASIVSRMLIWYQQAAGWADGASGAEQSSELIDPSSICSVSLSSRVRSTTAGGTSSPPLPPRSTGFVVTQVPISVGTFSVEDQNVQTALRTQLVLSELKKLDCLIDLFTSRDSGEAVNGMDGLYKHLGVWLRSEHSRTVRLLKSRLDALNENLGT